MCAECNVNERKKKKKIFLISYPFGTREMRRLNLVLGQIQFTFYVYIVIPIKFHVLINRRTSPFVSTQIDIKFSMWKIRYFK